MEELVKEKTANQLYKDYKDEGGTLNFSGWLNREKKKGVFQINKDINDEVYMALNGITEKKKSNRILGFPTTTLVLVGVIIVGAIVVTQVMKKQKNG
jgi:hypothetical protein